MTATLPNEPMSNNEELGVLCNPLLASPPGNEVRKKEVQSSNSEADLFAPPPAAGVAQQKVKRKKALPSAPPHFQKAYSKSHPKRNNPFGGGRLVDGQGYLVLVEPRGLPHGNR